MSEEYSQAHVTYDDHGGTVSLHCLRCNAVIARRREVPSNDDPSVFVYAMSRLLNYRETLVKISDGSVAYLPLCSTCARRPIDTVKALDVVKNGWEDELRHMGRPQEAIDALRLRTADLTIIKVVGGAHGQ